MQLTKTKLTAFQILFSHKAETAHLCGAISDDELQVYKNNLTSYQESSPEHQALYEQVKARMNEGIDRELKRFEEKDAIWKQRDAERKALEEEREAEARKRASCPPAVYFKVRAAMREAIELKVINNCDVKNIRQWSKKNSNAELAHILMQLQERIQKKRDLLALKTTLKARATNYNLTRHASKLV